jgi:hypothetical protein
MISIVELVLSLLSTTLANLKGTGAEQAVITDVEAAIAALEKVQGTPVTMGQLESLRAKVTF